MKERSEVAGLCGTARQKACSHYRVVRHGRHVLIMEGSPAWDSCSGR